ncbi:hypothetical protein FS837_012426 [Tulasnella sp. UAMH 9824]|nr:hypothetical protein FS837_012426 [Tulasnella sp. UAMH 9824]
MERPLALHESALSEPEYQAYTCILNELPPETAGAEWEAAAAQVPLGEAKGWIRGKYAVDAALLDQILRLFPATAFPASGIKRHQLLAILRLICHALAGLGVDKSLVSTQPSPLPPPPSQSSPYPKPPPPIRQGSSHTAPLTQHHHPAADEFQARTQHLAHPSRQPRSVARSRKRPGYRREQQFSSDGGRRSPTHSAPAITGTSRPASVTRSTSEKGATADESPFPSNNPFFRPPDSTAVTLPITLSPLPPRKPPSQATAPSPPPASHVPIQPPPQHPAPPPPPKLARRPSHTHSTSTANLIRPSLIAAKTTPKAPEGTLA